MGGFTPSIGFINFFYFFLLLLNLAKLPPLLLYFPRNKPKEGRQKMAFILYAIGVAVSVMVTASIIAAAIYLRQIRDLLRDIQTGQGYILHKMK